MPYIYKPKDDVRHLGQGPQGRMTVEKPTVYRVVQQLPIESDELDIASKASPKTSNV
jgi:hypothetical protein